MSTGTISRPGVGGEHRRVLKSAKDIVLPVEVVAIFKLGKVIREIETNGTAVILVQEFIRYNVNATCVSMSSEEPIPNADTMKGDIGAGGAGAMKPF